LTTVALVAVIAGCSGNGGNGDSYDLTITSTSGGSVTTPGEGTFHYDKGTAVNLTAWAEAGYCFVNWTGEVDGIVNVNDAITTLTMNRDYEITANFERIPSGQFSLTISSTVGGTVITPGEGIYTYDYGTAVNLMAAPDAGYRFVNWSGHVNSVADVRVVSTTITIKGDYSVTANFEEIPPVQYELTISTGAGGTVTIPGTGTYHYDAGTVVSLLAVPATGFQFVDWSGDVAAVANANAASTTIAMNGHYSITANFRWLVP
jgi:hypothetical protein